jgi:hypothetical protein
MSTEENEKKEARPRKIARSASTAERPQMKATEGDGAATAPTAEPAPQGDAPASGPKSERRWDVRAERPAPGPRPPRRRFSSDGDAPQRRPGTSGGRAMPDMPVRHGADRASPEFVDRWLSQKPRPRPEPGERRDRRDPNHRADRGPRRHDGAGEARPAASAARPSEPKAALAPRPVETKKLPTLSETILVGLPKVAVEGQRDKSANKPKTAKEALAAKTAQVPAKPAQDKPAEKAKVALKAEWLQAGASGAVQAIKEAGLAAEDLVLAWTQANEAGALVEAANDETIASAPRKAARRALAVLRARNVTIPERAPQKPAAAPAEEEVLEATFTPPDARGTSSFTIARRKGGDRAHIAEVIVRDEVGIIHAVSGWMSRSQIKEAHQRVAESSGTPPVVVPVEWARARIAEAKKLNTASQVLVPLGLEKCKELVEPTASETPHPVAELEKSLGDEAPHAGSATLHNEPEFRGWLPDARALDELLRKVGAAMSPDDAKDPVKVDTVMQAEIKAATDRFFTPEVRASVARRIRDAAISLRQRLGEAKAKDALGVARAIERAGLITAPPHEVEFLVAYFQKGVAVLAQQGGGQLRVPMAQT